MTPNGVPTLNNTDNSLVNQQNQIIKPEDIKNARIIQIDFKKDADYINLLFVKDTIDALFKNPHIDHPGSLEPVKIARKLASDKIRNWIKNNFTSFPVTDEISELLLDSIHTIYDGKAEIEKDDKGIRLSIYIDANKSYAKKGGIQDKTLAEGIAVILDKIFQTRNDIIIKLEISAPAVITHIAKGSQTSDENDLQKSSTAEAEQKILHAINDLKYGYPSSWEHKLYNEEED